MPISSEQFRQAMRRWTTGVTVVTAAHDGILHGMTVNSFTSVSLDPPLLLVCLERTTRTRRLVLDSAYFAVNLLSEAQEEISERFAGRIPDLENRLSGLEYHTLESGAPLLAGALANFDCRVSAVLEMATHTIVIGHVIAAQVPEPQPAEGQPLLYFNRDYHRLD